MCRRHKTVELGLPEALPVEYEIKNEQPLMLSSLMSAQENDSHCMETVHTVSSLGSAYLYDRGEIIHLTVK